MVIIWCYHVMLSSGMIAPPFFFFPETSLTPFLHTICEYVQYSVLIANFYTSFARERSAKDRYLVSMLMHMYKEPCEVMLLLTKLAKKN
jgi:hypothetical protein